MIASGSIPAAGAVSTYLSASFVSVVETTLPRKKSPASRSERRFGATAPTALPTAADGWSATTVCVAYVPSAKTTFFTPAVTAAIFELPPPGLSRLPLRELPSSSSRSDPSSCTRSRFALACGGSKKGVAPSDALAHANASSTCVALCEYSPMIHRHVPHTRDERIV